MASDNVVGGIVLTVIIVFITSIFLLGFSFDTVNP